MKEEGRRTWKKQKGKEMGAGEKEEEPVENVRTY